HAHPLERVRRRARLVRSAAQHAGAGARYAPRRLEDLRLAFNRARAGHDHHLIAADGDAAHVDDALLRPEAAAGEFVRLADADDFLHAVKELEFARVDGLDVSNHAEDGLLGAGRAMDVEAALDQLRGDALDVRLVGVLLHDDDHGISFDGRL